MRQQFAEMDYEWQMVKAIRELVASVGGECSDPDSLMSLLYERQELFGLIVLDNMNQLLSGDDWFNQVELQKKCASNEHE